MLSKKDERKPTVDQEAVMMLKATDLFEHILVDIASIGLTGEAELALTLYLVMTSRLLEKPLCAIVQGASSSGKSYAIETVAKLIPPDEIVMAHDFSEQAFYYLPPGSLKHKAVICGERLHRRTGRDGQARDNSKAFREMVGSGVLRKAVTTKRSNGKFRTEQIVQEGPIAYIESTTATSINDEDATRLLPLSTDESSEQTERVVSEMKRQAKGEHVGNSGRQAIIARHHAMQKLLKPLAVRIPFIDAISLPTNNITTRRTFGHLRSMIEAVALLRQYQKELQHDTETEQEFIEADATDYAIVFRLLAPILPRVYSGLNHKSLELFELLTERTSDGDSGNALFTSKDCQEWSGVSEATIRRRLKPLVDAGVVAQETFTKPYEYRIVGCDFEIATAMGLPTPEEIDQWPTVCPPDELTNEP